MVILGQIQSQIQSLKLMVWISTSRPGSQKRALVRASIARHHENMAGTYSCCLSAPGQPCFVRQFSGDLSFTGPSLCPISVPAHICKSFRDVALGLGSTLNPKPMNPANPTPTPYDRTRVPWSCSPFPFLVLCAYSSCRVAVSSTVCGLWSFRHPDTVQIHR